MPYIDEDCVISLTSDHPQYYSVSRTNIGSEVSIFIEGKRLRAILARREGNPARGFRGPPIKLLLSPVADNKRLEYWRPARNDYVDPEDKELNPAIALKAGMDDEQGALGRVIQIEKHYGEFIFRELCDEYFSSKMNAETAIAALEEAINWIRENTGGT